MGLGERRTEKCLGFVLVGMETFLRRSLQNTVGFVGLLSGSTLDFTKKDRTMEHTPLPWRVWSAPKEGPAPLFVVAEGNARRIISAVSLVGNSTDEANAQYIVTACNAHEKLLEACEAMIRYAVSPELELGQAAVAKAKGE